MRTATPPIVPPTMAPVGVEVRGSGLDEVAEEDAVLETELADVLVGTRAESVVEGTRPFTVNVLLLASTSSILL